MSKHEEKTKAILNLSNEGLNHALLMSRRIEPSVGLDDRYIIWGYPRDYPKSAKNYKDVIKTEIPLAISKNYILENSSLGGFMPIIIALPNDPDDLPRGLNPVVKFGCEMMIMMIQKTSTEKDMYWTGIKDRDEILKKILTSEFTPLVKRYAGTMVEDRPTQKMMPNTGNPSSSLGNNNNDKK